MPHVMIKVTLLQDARYEGIDHPKGAALEIEQSVARTWMGEGICYAGDPVVADSNQHAEAEPNPMSKLLAMSDDDLLLLADSLDITDPAGTKQEIIEQIIEAGYRI